MDLVSFLSSVLAPLGISATAAWWLSKTLITHRLEQERIRFQQLQQAEIRKEVEAHLADLTADREYELEARKRLYLAIGPLRVQLLLACRDLCARITQHGTREQCSTDIEQYYGRSVLYRLLRPLALGELAERQISYADFSVDPAAIELLKFKRAAFSAFTGRTPIRDHPRAIWSKQIEHVYFDNLSRAANALIIPEAHDKVRVMRFDEFENFLRERENLWQIAPFPRLLQDFQIQTKPILWTRLVCYGYICNDYLNVRGPSIGFAKRKYPVGELLTMVNDPFLQSHAMSMESTFREMIDYGI